MRKIIFGSLILAVQIFVTFIVLCSIYMFFALLDNEWGIDGMFGLFFIQPIYAIIFSGLTIMISLLVGLPIRLIPKYNDWWRRCYYISISGIIIGIVLLIISLTPAFQNTFILIENGIERIKYIPNIVLAVSGWFLTAFFLLHFYFPQKNSRNN